MSNLIKKRNFKKSNEAKFGQNFFFIFRPEGRGPSGVNSDFEAWVPLDPDRQIYIYLDPLLQPTSKELSALAYGWVPILVDYPFEGHPRKAPSSSLGEPGDYREVPCPRERPNPYESQKIRNPRSTHLPSAWKNTVMRLRQGGRRQSTNAFLLFYIQMY